MSTPGSGATSFTRTGRPAGRYSEYAVVGVNASGAMPASASSWKRQWQRPATPTCSATAASTRSVTIGAGALPATADESYATYQVRKGVEPWQADGTVFDPLPHGTTFGFGVRVQGNGGWSDAGSCSGSTPVLPPPPAPATPSCSYQSTDTSAPGGFTVAEVSGALYRIGSGAWGSNRSWSGLGAGTYHGSVHRPGATQSDGYNTSAVGPASGVSACGPVTVVDPYPTAWGVRAGCPPLYYSPPSAAPKTWQVRRVSSAQCQARWVVTEAGENLDTGRKEGDVVATGTWYFGSGAGAYYSANPNGVTTWNIPPDDYYLPP